LRARLVTPYYYKKVIATGVMNHDRFFGIDAPYRDAQKGGCWRPAPRVPGLEVKRSSDCTGPGRGRLEWWPRSPALDCGNRTCQQRDSPICPENADQIPPVPAVPGWDRPPAAL